MPIPSFRNLLGALALLPGAALAQSQPIPDPAQEIVIADLKRDDLIVTASGYWQPPELVGQAVTVLRTPQIDRLQLPSVADLIATTPGVSVTRNGGMGQPTAVRIRGGEDAQTLVLIDGVRVNDPSAPAGAFDFGTLMTGNIDRIEILRGPDAVPWGSAALGGIVNVTTNRTSGARAEIGSHGAASIAAQLAHDRGPVAATFGGGWFRDDGISAFRDGHERDGFEQFAGNARLMAELGGGLSVDLRGYYATGRSDYDGYPPPFYAFADTAEYARTHQAAGYAGLTLDARGTTHRLGLSLADTARDNYDPSIGTAPQFHAHGRTERIDYRGDGELAIGHLAWGLEHETSRMNDATTRYSTGIDSAWGQLRADLDALTLSGGVRIDRHRAFGDHVSVGANAVWRVAGDTSTIIRASFAQGFKAPSLYQLYSAYGNASLRPETTQSVDLGVTQQLIDRTLSVGVTAFLRDTSNQIDFSFAPRIDRPFGFYDNIARTRARGVEAVLTMTPSDRLAFNANYTLLDALDRTTDTALLRRPRHSLNLDLDWQTPIALRIGATLALRSASRDYDFVTFAPTMLAGYALTGLRASLPIGDTIELYGRIENVFDVRYETVSGYGSERRNLHIGARIRL